MDVQSDPSNPMLSRPPGPAAASAAVSDLDAAAERLKALGHPVRLAILRALAERSACCCGDVCRRLPLAQSTVSQHLKVLREAGLVSFRRDGVRSSYVLNPVALAALRGDLEWITALGAAEPEASPVCEEAS